jgi:hypothetical protein
VHGKAVNALSCVRPRRSDFAGSNWRWRRLSHPT